MGKGKARVLVIQELSLFVEKRYTFFTPTRLASEPPAFALMGALDRRWLSLLKMRAARSSFFFRSRPVLYNMAESAGMNSCREVEVAGSLIADR